MKKEEKKTLPPVSLKKYQRWVFECGAKLMEDTCDKKEIVNRLIDLSNYPIRDDACAVSEKETDRAAIPRVKVIIEGGITSEVLADCPVELEVVNIDKDYEDYDRLRDYEVKLHEDKSLMQIDFSSANFEED